MTKSRKIESTVTNETRLYRQKMKEQRVLVQEVEKRRNRPWMRKPEKDAIVPIRRQRVLSEWVE